MPHNCWVGVEVQDPMWFPLTWEVGEITALYCPVEMRVPAPYLALSDVITTGEREHRGALLQPCGGGSLAPLLAFAGMVKMGPLCFPDTVVSS